MGWETRQRGGRYYTRSYRQGGQVKRRYVGAGIWGKLAAMADEERHLEALEERERIQAEIDRWKALDAQFSQAHEAIMATVKQSLVDAGFHQHHRGDWRRKRAQST